MPRTKQNNPKNLKDKIEEAQKELKDPKGSQKGISESSRGNADNIKGLKRKKVVAENRLEKIPKSPVKKPLQTKTSETALHGAPSKETTPSCSSSSNSPSHHPSTSPSGKRDPQYAQPVAISPHEGSSSTEVERLKEEETVSRPPSLEQTDGEEGFLISAEGSRSKDNKRQDISFGGDLYHSSAPLDVLLKAMEPDFTTLAERKNSLQDIGKPATNLNTQSSGELTSMPAVNVGLHTHPSHMQTYYIDKQGNFIGIAAPMQGNVQTSTQVTPMQSSPLAAPHFMPVASNPEKPSMHVSLNTGPSSITHAPVPSGSNTLPQSQPPVVHTCQSLSASVPSTIQVPVTPGSNQVQMTTVMNFGTEQLYKDQKPKKPGKYVCEYCSRACAKPSVLLKHIRSHTGERPYPCVTCGFSFKTKSNLYKHKKSHAHAIKLGLIARSESGGGSLSQESDKALGTHSEAEESGDSDEDGSTADLDPDSSQSSVAALSENSLQNTGATQASHGEADSSAVFESIKPPPGQRAHEPKVTAALPKVVVYPVNVSPLRADSPRVTGAAPEQAAAQRQREFQTANLRSSITVLSSLKEVDGTNPSLDTVSEDEDQQCKSPLLGGHAQLQRQQATDFSQQQQAKCLLSPRSLGSTDSGYFSRSESADQAMSPPSPFVKITPPVDTDKNTIPNLPTVVATVMHVAAEQKPRAIEGQMRPPLEVKALSLEERISKLISDNEAVVDNKQLDSVKPRRTSLSRRGSIDSPKSYIFKDSFQFDLKPMGRRSSSSSDIPKSPFTPTDKSKPVFLLSVPSQYPPMDCLPITRSNSMPTTPGHSALPLNVAPLPHHLRMCQSFDDKISLLNDEVFSSAPPTPNPAIHSRTLVRQAAVEDFSTSEGHGLPTVRSMDEGYHGPSSSTELMQRSRSFEHHQDRNRKPQQNKGTMYECETCRNRYRKLENFETHKKFYCSELHGPKNKPIAVKETDQDVFHVNILQPIVPRSTGGSGILDQQTSIRKRRKMKSVGDEDDQSPTDTIPPCSVSFEQPTAVASRAFSQHAVIVDIQPKNNQSKLPQIQLVARGINSSDSRLSPIRETQTSTSTKGDLQRQGSGTSVIRHTNSLSRPNSFETESIDRASPVDNMEKDPLNKLKVDAIANVSADSYHEKISKPQSADYGKQRKEQCADGTVAAVSENLTPVHQSRLVRQNNIQVPEILVTEEPDREHETQTTEPADKPVDQFNWPQRSESLSKLPAEKLPPKKKRIRLAQMDHSSGESSFESSLSQSLSRDSSLSRCSSISASFDRDEPSRSESPSRVECLSKIPEPQGLPTAFNTLGVPGMMRRAASEQITCTQPSVEITSDYRSKSFDCGNVSPSRSLSPVGQPKSGQISAVPQVPLIERRRGPLVRQMSLKIGPESQQPVRKVVPLDKTHITNVSALTHIANRRTPAQPFTLHTGEPPLQKNEQMVQSIHLGSPIQQPQVHGLPHPWHQTSRVQICQKMQQPPSQILVCRDNVLNKPTDSEEKKCFMPKYQLQCALRASQTFSFSNTQRTQIALPVLTIPIANPILSMSKSSDVLQNAYVAQPNQQAAEIKTQTVVLSGEHHRDPFDQTQAGTISLPQILITHDQMHPAPAVSNKNSLSSTHSVDSDTHAVPIAKKDRSQTQTVSTHNHSGERASSLGSLHCTQKLASVTLCPQQEPTASSKRMLSPANSLDIYMEKHQKRAKDEHGVACLTDGRSVNYLNSKMSEVTRQRKQTLVRQVCTTEPVDSPIETEAPPLPQVKTDGEKDSEATDDVKPMSPDGAGLEKNTSIVIHEEAGPDLNTTRGSQGTSLPANNTLKPQEKAEEQRWTPAKSPIRPSSFHGSQMKLTTSVSVVNTKDSHRLSFPSLKTTTTFTWCFLMKRKPLHVPQTDLKTSAYGVWTVKPNNHNPLGLPTKVVMSLFDSKQSSKKIHYTSAIRTSGKSDILSYSGKLKDVMPRVPITQKSISVETRSKVQPETQASNDSDKDSASKTEPRRVKIFDGGFKSNEEYVYVRGRGRGKYICEECGIRCKKPSMLRKHIRTHSDVRPYHCVHCNFSFKTKGNLTKHMKSKAHSKKCLEMGVPAGLIEDQDADDSGDRSQVSSADRQDSDGDDSDGPDDEENDDNEEEEEDSQAESGLSTNPSVSASPQHIPSKEADVPPSALLAQMSISSVSLHLSQPPPPESHTSDSESVSMMSPVSLSKQISISGSCYSPMPLPYSPLPVATTSDSYTSDTESVHMMSPVSPCRQMSIDYPDFDVPPSPPVPGKVSKLGQDNTSAPTAVATSESGIPVDRGTQTSSYAPHGSMHFPPQGLSQTPGAETQTHLFSHLPLHSQQPSRSSYSMVPVGGIQLVPAGLAAYSTFVPIQAGPVQLTIPAVSVIHRNSSPLPAPNTPPQPEGLQTQPLVVQEPISSVVPCFPLGQVTGLQAQTIQPVGLETLNLMGLTNTGLASTQLLNQQGLTLNATLGLQVLAANPTSQSNTGPQTHVPGLQIVNIALPAIIPSLSPLSTLSPLPGSSERQGSPEAQGAQPSQNEHGLVSLRSCMSASPTAPFKVSSSPGLTSGSRASPRGSSGSEFTQTVEREERNRSPAPENRADGAKESLAEGACDPAHPIPPPVTSWQKEIDDYNEVSSDDEDRLVIAT
ncbi:zinc finger protein 40 isoform X1 [Micropterus salmoides]|uniref:zinc finger protein 40 isoform X1 n=1 Tax=Micropterus salmoides TaxID=27706 RepID=UPI0018ED06BB|nr:zinc finger protein 40 isoform X1 [Micropterus salmoides]XP_038579972.1 zinc finger protein 40 isoform X1 [Micropterus salmoides]XP_038579973.1 zinc finger protein 40 isoform X1 [Micropterus salmoides]XP_038579974.1 zinc finger protein 40 isoform X1 [Micropterus salmoides]XP_038579975.1 zinc finger protein 40 isoform X1 [Micropterus salmoides]XP_038579976.1 zinc finger protein 40 isoform X1 [Micropterus salmoides]XP_038579978.1 zinc finger protein 40 isoform X1 [Micropterus salmoides]XP_0